PLDQGRLDLRLGLAADAPAAELRRDHLGVVDDERIAGLEPLRQVGDDLVAQNTTTLYHQKPRGITRARRPQRDAFRRKLEVEESGTHAAASSSQIAPGSSRWESAGAYLPLGPLLDVEGDRHLQERHTLLADIDDDAAGAAGHEGVAGNGGAGGNGFLADFVVVQNLLPFLIRNQRPVLLDVEMKPWHCCLRALVTDGGNGHRSPPVPSACPRRVPRRGRGETPRSRPAVVA